jgi:hypothetical protein
MPTISEMWVILQVKPAGEKPAPDGKTITLQAKKPRDLRARLNPVRIMKGYFPNPPVAGGHLTVRGIGKADFR